MTKYRNKKGKERLSDAITYRISASQRAFLEKLAEEKNIGLCEAARYVLDEVMTRATGAEECH
jgi:hypothetical protein